MTFRFRLERVLELRAEAEQARARTLRDASEIAELTRKQQAALESLRTLQRETMDTASTGSISAGEMQHFSYVLEHLDQHLSHATEEVTEAHRVLDEAQAALIAASRDRRVLDRLKERHTERWQEGALHKDRVEMDEIALTRFTRARMTGAAKAPVPDRADRNTTPPATPVIGGAAS